MTVLAWDPVRFDVGVARMNSQHQGLVALMNAIHDRATAGAGKAELAGLFSKLAQAPSPTSPRKRPTWPRSASPT